MANISGLQQWLQTWPFVRPRFDVEADRTAHVLFHVIADLLVVVAAQPTILITRRTLNPS